MTEKTLSHEYSCFEPPLKHVPVSAKTLPRWILLLVIRIYQLVFSPAIPADTCRFYPSCSRYSYQAVYKYGVLKGGWMSIKRIMRCNPFNPGGIDPVP